MNSTDALESGVTGHNSPSSITWTGADVVQIVILLIIAVFGTIGNILLIITIYRDRKLKIPGNYFIINLAISDLIITAFSIPVILSNFIRYHLNREDLIEVSGFCQTTAYLKVLGLHVSWYSLAFIALNRYFSLCRMQEYATFYTKKRVLATIGLIWIFVLLINFPIMAGWALPRDKILPENSSEGYYYAYRRGRPPVIYDKSSHDCVLGVRNEGGYTYANGFFVMSVPLLSIIFCYSLVSMEIVRNRRKYDEIYKFWLVNPLQEIDFVRIKKNMAAEQLRRRYKKERKISLMLAVVVLVFVACWAPVIIYDYSHTIDNDTDLDVARLVFSWLALSNSAMNPGLYAMLSKAFRNGYKKLILLIINKLTCGNFSTDSSLQDFSSASISRNESRTFSRRVTRFNTRGKRYDQDAKTNQVLHKRSMAAGKETAVSIIEVKNLKNPEAISTSSIVITTHMENNEEKSIRDGEDAFSAISTATEKKSSRNYEKVEPCSDKSITSTQGESSHKPNVPSSSQPLPEIDDVEGAEKPAAKQFKSLLDLMDDSSSTYSEGGIYLGGSVFKTDESG